MKMADRMRDIDRAVRSFCADLRREHSEQFERDPRAFRARVVRYVKMSMPLRAGRPPKKEITLALQMLKDGAAWGEIYKRCLPSDSSGAERRVLALNLRCAVRSRRMSARRRKAGSDSSANKSDSSCFQLKE